MNAVCAASTDRELRAISRIAEHCAALDRLSESRAPACERLETELGEPLATFLVGALRGRPARHTGWLAA
jgi:hypothetical protein